MTRLLLLLIFFSISLLARFDAYPVQKCEAFNNLKHTKNTHHVILDTSIEYTVLDKHKGQYLILVKGENPAQRWVNGVCFDTDESKEKKYVSYKSETYDEEQNILVLSWHNAFCQTHRYKKECKRALFQRFEESRFVLHGLWPQPKNNVYCNVDESIIALDKRGQWNALPMIDVKKETLNKVIQHMPGAVSNLHRHEWYKHGSCYGETPQKYFSDAISLIEQFNATKITSFFQNNESKYVTLAQVRYLIDRAFGQGTGKRVEMRCNGKLITELWLHLGSGNNDLRTLLKNGEAVDGYCRGGIIDRAGY